MSPRRAIWPRIAALSLATLLPSLGTSITNVMLPALAQDFDASMPEVQWVVIAYLVAVTSFILAAGRMGDLFGRRRLLLAGIALFMAASAAGSVAPNLWALVATRAAQGIGASAMMALTIAMIGEMVPRHRTGSAIGLLGTVSAIGTAIGPTLGGGLLSYFHWPALFMALAAAAMLALVLALACLPADKPDEGRKPPLDASGVILLAVSLSSICIPLTLGAALSNRTLFAAIALAIGATAAFVHHERAAPSPLLRFALLRDRRLGSGLTATLLVSSIVMTTLVIGPFHLSQSMGLLPAQTGLVMSVGPLVAALTGIPAGRMVDALGSFRVGMAGLALLVTGSAAMALLPHGFRVLGYAGSLALITSGYALFQAATTTTLMQDTPADRKGLTSALLGLARNFGFILGASAMGTLYALARQIPSGPTGGPTGGATGDLGLRLAFVVATLLALCAAAILYLGTTKDRHP